MMNSKFIIIALLLGLIACNQQSRKGTGTSNEPGSNGTVKNGTTPNAGNLNYDYIVFGRYCGMCGKDCATMYKLDRKTHQLRFHRSDSFFKSYSTDSISFQTVIDDQSKIDLAEKIIQYIPDSLNKIKEPKERFGCPDCADGCGMYFEFINSGTKKSFYIDYQTHALPDNYIKPFAEHLKRTIDSLGR